MSFSLNAVAAETPFLADQHVSKGYNCAACHGKDTPKSGAQVTTGKCLECHQSLEAVNNVMIKKGQQVVPNPHINHQIGLNCNECHQGHKTQTNSCSECHTFTFRKQTN